MIAVIDYDAGNLYNVGNALCHLGADYELTDDPRRVEVADRVILPGVGSARAAMTSLDRRNLVQVLKRIDVPFLGICLGMQLFYERSEEEACPGLGLIPGSVSRFDATRLKVPHIGWNAVRPPSASSDSPELLRGIPDGGYFYFVHSYRAMTGPETAAVTEYGSPFSSIVRQGNRWGVQFHPERSGENGLRLLRNFLELEAC